MKNFAQGLNRSALKVVQQATAAAASLGIQHVKLPCGTQLFDFGVHVPGGLAAGVKLAEICMAGRAEITLVAGDRQLWPGAWVQVATDQPVQACMLSQYAGWPVSGEKFFAMGSGPMRVKRGKEPVLLSLSALDDDRLAVGTLECDVLPSCAMAEQMARECSIAADQLWLAIAPTRSIAGCVQVVARSVETAMHKLHELHFPLERVQSAYGYAPLPPPTPDFGLGIGRTNDAVLYAAHVTLWVEGDDDQLAELGMKLPSCASRDFGAPFAEIFKHYDYDFYKVDPGLFSPAEVTLVNLKTGNSWRFGSPQPDLIRKSFGTK